MRRGSPVTAIDILLEPDATMVQHAQADNARLLKAYPGGFALDETHHPHITMLQQFVRTADLGKVYTGHCHVWTPLADQGLFWRCADRGCGHVFGLFVQR
jgi:hypothetical protein